MARVLTLFCEETGEEITLPTRWEICCTCEGDGTSSAYLGAITESDREPGGTWEDPDDFREYMRGGYDRTCDECRGAGKVRVVDHDKLTPDQRRELAETIEAEREYEATVAAERRMGA
jgi:hypothetical protein